MPPIARRSSFRVGPWTVEPDKNLLTTSDVSVPVLPRSMEILEYLAQRNNTVVTSEELITALWGKRFVGENPLYKHVALLRQALRLPDQDTQFIKTVPKKGYSLVANVAFPDDYKHATEQASVIWSDGSPFRGLQSFEKKHAAIFFGRDQMIKQVANALRENAASGVAFTLLLGASGSGKSSLVRAGVAPYLSESTLAPEVSEWSFATFAPSEFPKDLLRGLAVAIASSGFGGAKNQSSIDQLALRLTTAPEDISSVLVPFQTPEEIAKKKLFLFIDQLEELFVLDGITHAQREVFVDTLDVLARLGYVWVTAAMRNDYYPRCSELETLTTLKKGNGQVDIEPPSPSEIAQMIRLPARAANLNFEEESDNNRRLDDLLRDEAVNQPGSLPLLQFALDALYEKRTQDRMLTIDAYKELGGLSGALARRAEITYESLSSAAKHAAPRVFGALVDIDASTGQRTKVPLTWSDNDPAEIELLDSFVNKRLITGSLNAKGERVASLVHEALIRHWPRLKDWLNENDELLRTRNRVRNGAERWHGESRSKDLLLPAGRRLQDAVELNHAEHIDISALMQDYISHSQRLANRNRNLVRAALTSIAGLAVATGVTALYALSARDDAVAQKTQAESLVGFMVGDLREKLVPVGRLDILETVGNKAMGYFASQDISELSHSALVNHAKTLEQIGQVHLGQGSMTEALTAFEAALTNSNEIVARDASNLDALYSSGNAHYWVGYVQWKLGRLDLTQQHWRSYHDIASSLVLAEPHVATWQLELSYALNNLGTVAYENNQFESARSFFTQSIEAKEELVKQDPDNTSYQIELADSVSWLAATLKSRGQLKSAEQYYNQMLAIATRTLELQPENATSRYRLGLAHQHAGNISEMLGNYDKAFGHFKEARLINNQLLELDETNSRWQRDRVYLQSREAKLYLSLGELDRAQELFEQSLNGTQILIDKDPANRAWHQLWAVNSVTYSRVLIDNGRLSNVKMELEKAIDTLTTELESNTQSSTVQRGLAQALLVHHQLLTQSDSTVDNTKNLQQLDELIESFPDPLHNPDLLSVVVDYHLLRDNQAQLRATVESLYSIGYRERPFVQTCAKLKLCN